MLADRDNFSGDQEHSCLWDIMEHVLLLYLVNSRL